MSDAPSGPSQIVSNAEGWWGLGKDIFTSVYPFVSSKAKKREAVRSLNDRICEWAKEAKDKHGRWQQPMLTRNALKEHLLLK
jgi:hypothetical protein